MIRNWVNLHPHARSWYFGQCGQNRGFFKSLCDKEAFGPRDSVPVLI